MDSPFLIVPGNEKYPRGDVIGKHLHSRRTQSFSSSSFCSCSSSFNSMSFDSNPEESPWSHVNSPQFSRIPFSWEQQPGIPKKSDHPWSSTNTSPAMLPLPPAATSTPTKKFQLDTIFRKKTSNENSTSDPFTTALLECSKDLDKGQLRGYCNKGKILRGVSNGFGLLDRYISCKTSCTVIPSVAFLPRASRTAYHITQ